MFISDSKVFIRESQTVVHYGWELVVRCEFEGGFPLPTVTWMKNSVEFGEDSRTSINTTFSRIGYSGVSTLKIMGVLPEDGGLYTCRATSSSNSDDANITVIFLRKWMVIT